MATVACGGEYLVLTVADRLILLVSPDAGTDEKRARHLAIQADVAAAYRFGEAAVTILINPWLSRSKCEHIDMSDTTPEHQSAELQDRTIDARLGDTGSRETTRGDGSAIVASSMSALSSQSALAAAAGMNAKGALAGMSALSSQSALLAAAGMNAKGALAGLSALSMDAYGGGFRASVINGLMAHVLDASHIRGEVPGFREAALTMFGDLGLDTGTAEDDVPFAPTLDDRAYEIISRGAPEVAVAVNMAAARVPTPFWSRRAVRNALAWVLVAFVATAYVVGAALPPPWAWILNTLLGLSGASAPGAYRLITRPTHDADSSPPASQEH
jgi:hypothetical protein